jgi:hypothetical protein
MGPEKGISENTTFGGVHEELSKSGRNYMCR